MLFYMLQKLVPSGVNLNTGSKSVLLQLTVDFTRTVRRETWLYRKHVHVPYKTITDNSYSLQIQVFVSPINYLVS